MSELRKSRTAAALAKGRKMEKILRV